MEENVIHMMPTFCNHCKISVPWYLLYQPEEWISSEGISLKYYSVAAICEHCNHEVYVLQINDLNVEHRERLYEKFGGHHGTS